MILGYTLGAIGESSEISESDPELLILSLAALARTSRALDGDTITNLATLTESIENIDYESSQFYLQLSILAPAA